MLAFRLILLCCSITLAPSLLAAEAQNPSMEAFRRGIEQFQAGNLEGARAEFEAAQAGGLASLSLIYNLGVVHYRLGHYAAAEQTFLKLRTSSHRALASYNLGLVALAQGDESAARVWFSEVLALSSPEQLRALAEAQIEKLAAGPADTSRRATGQGYLSFSGGYDSNIAGLPDTSLSSEGGGFGELLAAGSAPVSEYSGGQIRLGGVAYGRRYPGNDDYDTSLLLGELAWSRNLVSVVQGANVSVSQSWFDTDALERRYGIEGFQRWSDCGGLLALTRCTVALAGARVDGGEGFDAYDGEWYRLRLAALHRFEGWLLDAEYQWEVNDRADLRAGEQFVSVSPHHHQLELVARYRVLPELTAGWMGAFRYSRYQDPHTLFEGNVLVTERRVDARVEAGLFVERPLNARWTIRAEWQVEDNDSRIDRYDYRRHTLYGSLEGSF